MPEQNYTIFITNQNKLSEIAGITPQHLSSIKAGTRGASDELLSALVSLTEINRDTWISKSSKLTLKRELKAFFKKEKDNESEFLRSQRRVTS